MTNTALLQDRIKKSGLKKGFIAAYLDISYAQLAKKMQNQAPFKAYEIQLLCKLLSITSLEDKELIFFAQDVEENSTKTKEA